MRIALLGATGRTGKLILHKAIENGHQVNVLVRDKSRLPSFAKGIIVIEGSTLDKNKLSQVIHECDAVVNSLNISRNSDFPWSKLRTPQQFLSNTVTNLVEVMRAKSVKRLVSISAWGTNETFNHLPLWFRWLIQNSNIGFAYRDHERQELIISQSELDWTMILPAGLTNATKKADVQVSFNNQPKPKLTIGRSCVADFVISTLEKGLYIKRMPVISKK